MRRFLPISILLLCLQSLISQNLNIAGHDGVDASGDLVTINSKTFFLYSSNSNCCRERIGIDARDDSGNTIFKKEFGLGQINTFGRLIKTNDNALFMNGFSMGSCDTGPRQEHIVKMDTLGNIIFSTVVPTTPATWINSRIVGIAQHVDSSFYLVSSYELLHYSSNGVFISKIDAGLTSISAITALSNGNLVVNGEINSIRVNVIMSTLATIIVQQPCTDAVVKYFETPNFIFAKTANGILEKYNLSLTFLGNSSATINSSNYKIHDFVVRNDSLFIAGMFQLLHPFYAVVSSSFTVFFQTQPIFKGINPTGIALNNKNKIQIITTAASKSDPNYTFTGLYALNLTGTFNSVSDIGVTGFSNINTVLYGAGYTYKTPFITMDVTVKNFGTDTVNNFYLNYYAFQNSAISWCYILLHKYCETPIPPGGIITVPTGTFYGQPFMSNSSADSKLKMCVFTTAPNASNDINIDNDAFCDSVLFTVTGLNENTLPAQNIQIYPNPSEAGFTIDSDVEIKTIEILNSLGQIIQLESVNAKQYYLNNAPLKSGVYFIKVETEKGTVRKKIIKN